IRGRTGGRRSATAGGKRRGSRREGRSNARTSGGDTRTVDRAIGDRGGILAATHGRDEAAPGRRRAGVVLGGARRAHGRAVPAAAGAEARSAGAGAGDVREVAGGVAEVMGGILKSAKA